MVLAINFLSHVFYSANIVRSANFVDKLRVVVLCQVKVSNLSTKNSLE